MLVNGSLNPTVTLSRNGTNYGKLKTIYPEVKGNRNDKQQTNLG